MFTKHLNLAQVCILPFSIIERGSRGADTHSVGIMVIILCLIAAHFPTQFVHGNWL